MTFAFENICLKSFRVEASNCAWVITPADKWFTCRQQAEFNQLEQAKFSTWALMTCLTPGDDFNRKPDLVETIRSHLVDWFMACGVSPNAAVPLRARLIGITSISSGTVRWDMFQRWQTDLGLKIKRVQKVASVVSSTFSLSYVYKPQKHPCFLYALQSVCFTGIRIYLHVRGSGLLSLWRALDIRKVFTADYFDISVLQKRYLKDTFK